MVLKSYSFLCTFSSQYCFCSSRRPFFFSFSCHRRTFSWSSNSSCRISSGQSRPRRRAPVWASWGEANHPPRSRPNTLHPHLPLLTQTKSTSLVLRSLLPQLGAHLLQTAHGGTGWGGERAVVTQIRMYMGRIHRGTRTMASRSYLLIKIVRTLHEGHNPYSHKGFSNSIPCLQSVTPGGCLQIFLKLGWGICAHLKPVWISDSTAVDLKAPVATERRLFTEVRETLSQSHSCTCQMKNIYNFLIPQLRGEEGGGVILIFFVRFNI